jgi:hypothetical protein
VSIRNPVVGMGAAGALLLRKGRQNQRLENHAPFVLCNLRSFLISRIDD